MSNSIPLPSRLFEIESSKTYANEKNAIRAVEKAGLSGLRHFLMKDDDGRVFPVFVGIEALHRGVHFHFNVIA